MCMTHVQVTQSFKNLVARNPDLCLNFIKEVSLRLNIPALPDRTDVDGHPLSDADSDSPGPATPSAASHSFAQIPSLGTLLA